MLPAFHSHNSGVAIRVTAMVDVSGQATLQRCMLIEKLYEASLKTLHAKTSISEGNPTSKCTRHPETIVPKIAVGC